MAGAAKNRANREREQHASVRRGQGSSSGETSSSGKATRSAAGSTSGQSTSSRVSRRGYDGNRDPGSPGSRNPATSRPVVEPKNVDLGTVGWLTIRGHELTSLAPRPPNPSTVGQPIKMGLNTFNVTKVPTADIYQYDVVIGNGVEKRGLINKVWASSAVQKELGQGWIFDGNKLAWSLNKVDREIRLIVDLDKEQGREPRPGKENISRVFIRCTNKVRMHSLVDYMDGHTGLDNAHRGFDNAVLETINFLDHLLREWPSKRLTAIKRSFFERGQQRFSLGGGIEAFKGVYQSMRIVHGGQKARLSVNVDVANGTFWSVNKVSSAALLVTARRDINDLIHALQPGSRQSAAMEKQLKKLRKLHVLATHRGQKKQKKPGDNGVDEYVIEKFVYKSAREQKFEKDGKMVSVYDYFFSEFGFRLQYPDLPLCKMTKGKNTMLPMEVLTIKEIQRFAYKLDERQTSQMIKFAVTPPPERRKDVHEGLGKLDWSHDPFLKQYGLEISRDMASVDGRLIPAPKVQFGTGEARPGTSGRWDLKGKKFLEPNPAPLKAWSWTVIPGRRGGKPDKSVIENFIREFIKVYTLHGGRVENKQPAMTLASGDDVSKWVTAAWNAAGNQVSMRPQMLVFILPDKDSITYGRIKRSADCRYGVVSQCMQYAHVTKAQPQYISNVCMKFNAKLGGSTCRAVGARSSGPWGMFSKPTLVIGADVSHAAPGAQTPSMAAMTVSMDRLGVKYAAACETNGFRVEMIQQENINALLKPLLQTWTQNVGGGRLPERVIYFRDGVSEKQYYHVIEQEVADMKKLFKSANPQTNIPFVVIVGGKRHHIRFFPEKGGDRNGNPLPGSLIETGVTHPFENDFYLNSHAAIKGTARPMHYHVLMNEAKLSNEELQTLIYEQCYQYIRATTPISQHPAIYYAHLASNRAIPHDLGWAGSTDGQTPPAPPPGEARPRSGSQGGSQGRGASQSRGAGAGHTGGSSTELPTDATKLLPMPSQGGIGSTMWFI